MESPGLSQETIDQKPKVPMVGKEVPDYFKELRQRFIGFKKDKYLSNLEHYQRLAKDQETKHHWIPTRRSLCGTECGKLGAPKREWTYGNKCCT